MNIFCAVWYFFIGRPDPLTNCTVLNHTSTAFQVECVEGFDGGLEQHFVVEVYPMGKRQYTSSIKSKDPYFELKGLDPGMEYVIILAAINKKGRSSLTELKAYTLKNPEKQTGASYSHFIPIIYLTMFDIKNHLHLCHLQIYPLPIHRPLSI